MTITELITAALAVWEAIEIWRHGEIFATKREQARMRGWDVLGCAFCAAPWISLLFANWVMIGRFSQLMTLPIYALAVARLANLGNDITHRWSRTPKQDVIPAANPVSGYSNHEEETEEGPRPG
jgi:hypothetical protein